MEERALEFFQFMQGKLEGIPVVSGIGGIIVVVIGISFIFIPFLNFISRLIIKTGIFVCIVSIIIYLALYKIGPQFLNTQLIGVLT